MHYISVSILENITENFKFYTTREKILDQEVLKICNLVITNIMCPLITYIMKRQD